ncbi:hypothetical protein [Dasania marina]|uniref:hypothetical protein n=1 Tax=Dasania marina TaxID=471499 RepID=UPI00037B3EFA|nr:hypothetical protein [Dasania marina]
MNKLKKIQKTKRQALYQGLSENEKAVLDSNIATAKHIWAEVDAEHSKLFSEEFDHTFDDHADCNRRGQGVNPMSEEYIERVAEKRLALGVSPLSENGMSIDGSSLRYTLNKVLTERKQGGRPVLSMELLIELKAAGI